jgi:hypothetical protein
MPRAQWLLLMGAGAFNLAFAVFHLAFPRLFHWDQELARLAAVNRAIVQVLNFCLVYLFALFACVLLVFPAEMAATALGRFLLLGMAAFWVVRAIYQPMFFSLRHWLSSLLFVLFLAGAALHLAAWLVARG